VSKFKVDKNHIIFEIIKNEEKRAGAISFICNAMSFIFIF